jgi:hypothetical protein
VEPEAVKFVPMKEAAKFATPPVITRGIPEDETRPEIKSTKPPLIPTPLPGDECVISARPSMDT